MNTNLTHSRDVFIIHTKGDPYEAQLVEAIKEWLNAWGLTSWVYEDWEWLAQAEAGSRWRAKGTMDQLDVARHLAGDPQPFRHRPPGPRPDRDILAWMFERCGALILIAPRAVEPTEGTHLELEVLEENPHGAVTSISWHEENAAMVHRLQSFFDYRMPSPFPKDFGVAAETAARAAWLGCTLARLRESGAVGSDLCRQLARSDLLLNRIARHALRPIAITPDPDPLRAAVVPTDATAEGCAAVLQFWLGGAGYTAQQLTSGRLPGDMIEASKLVRGMLWDWCAQAQARFPALSKPSARILFPLGTAKLRLGKVRDAIAEFDAALEAEDAQTLRSSIRLNRGLSWAELGVLAKAAADYTDALDNPSIEPELRNTVLYNRALAWINAGTHDKAEADLEAVLSSASLDRQTQALALIELATIQRRSGRLDEAIGSYGRVIESKKAPAEARVKALLNRGALRATLDQHVAAIADYDAVLQAHESQPRQKALALFNRAYSKALSDDVAAAEVDYREALGHSGSDRDLREAIETRLAALRRGDNDAAT